MQFLVSTTGSDVTVKDLGVVISDPTVDRDLSLEFTIEELQESDDLEAALQAGSLVLKLETVEYGVVDVDGSQYRQTLLLEQTFKGEFQEGLVSEEELLAGFTNSEIVSGVFPVALSSTTAVTNVVVSNNATFFDWKVAQNDKFVISGNAAAGTYTVNNVISQTQLEVVESIVTTSGSGTFTIFHPSGARKVGVDVTNTTQSKEIILQNFLEDIDGYVANSLLLDGSRSMTGDLDLGGNDIINAGNISIPNLDGYIADGDTAGGDLSGTYPNPSVSALTETSGPTSLTIGSVADGQVLTRSGNTLIGTTGADDWNNVSVTLPDPIFEADIKNSVGPEQLPSSVTINGITVEAHDEFRADSIVNGPGFLTGDGFWPNTGTNKNTALKFGDPSRVKPTLHTTPWGGLAPGYMERVVDGAGGTTWSSNDGSIFNMLENQDFIIELVYKIDQGANTPILRKGTGSAAYFNWRHQGSSGGIRFDLRDANQVDSGGRQSFSTTPLHHWSHVMFFWDRDAVGNGESAAMISNGAFIGDDYSALGDMSSLEDFFIGGFPTSYGSCIFSHVSFWRREDWFAGGAQNQVDWQAIYDERHAYLSGLYASKAGGNPVPVSMTRSTTATTQTYHPDGYAVIHNMEIGLPRYYEKKDPNGNIVGGLLVEDQVTNRVDFLNGIGTTTSAQVNTEDGYESPDKLNNAILFNPVGSFGDHALSLGISNDPLEVHTASAYFKSDTGRYVRILCLVPTVSVVFDIIDGSVFSTTGTVISTSVEDCGNGWFRCSFTTTSSNNTARQFFLNAFDNSGNQQFTPTGNERFFYYNVQYETGYFPTSPINTPDQIEVTRNADSIYWDGENNINNGNRKGDLTLESYISSTGDGAGDQTLFVANDEGSATDAISLKVDSLGLVSASILSNEGDFADIDSSAPDNLDAEKTISLSYIDDNATISYDGFEDTISSGTVPNEITRLGFDLSGGTYPNALIQKISIREDNVTTVREDIYNNNDGFVGINTEDPNEALTVDGSVSFKNQTSDPESDLGYGKLYADSNSDLFYKDEDGNAVQLNVEATDDWINVESQAPDPIFEVNVSKENIGPEMLSSSLTINGTTVEAADEFRASSIVDGPGFLTGDGFWPNTGFNETGFLRYSNSSQPPPQLQNTPWGGLAPGYLERVVDGTPGTAWQANDESVFQFLDNHDFVIELVYRNDAFANTPIINKASGSPRFRWNHQGTSGGIRFSVTDDLGNGFDGQNSSTTPAYHWSHLMFFWDRDSAYPGTAAMISNGAYVPRNLSALTGSMEISDLFYCGGALNAYGLGIFCHIAFWRKEDWFAGGAQNEIDWQAIYDERHAYLTGLYASRAEGNPIPASMTRSTSATTQTYDSNGNAVIHNIEAGMPRYYEKKDPDGNIVGGLLVEDQVTNRIDAMTNISILSGDTDVLIADGYDSPDGLRNAFYAVDGSGSQFHHVSDFTFYSNPNWHTFSVWLKPINARYLRIGENSNRVYVRYDMQTGTVIGQDGSQVSPSFGIEDRGNGWYYCWFVAYMDVNSSIMQITIGNSPTNFGYLPVEGNDFYYWNPQITTTPYPVSEIPTSGAQVTRNADSIYWDGTDNINNSDRKGTVEVNAYIASTTDQTATQSLFVANDGGVSADSISINVNSEGAPVGTILSAEGDFADNVSTTPDNLDDEKTIVLSYADDDSVITYDGAIDRISSGTVPGDIDRVGFDFQTDAYPNALIQKVTIRGQNNLILREDIYNANTGFVGFNLENPNEMITVDGAISLKHRNQSPENTSGFGKIYTDGYSDLYYKNDSGNITKLNTGPDDHRDLDQLVHNIAEDAFTNYTYSGTNITNITTYTDVTETTKVREEQVTYSGNNVTEVVVIQYDAAGLIKERLTITYSYSGNDIINSTSVLEEF